MRFAPDDLVALLIATSFAAGLNVYATVATLGLLGQAGWLALPPPLHILTSWYVIAASAVLFLVEFFADKIPAFDLVWNALHTFIRIPIAALLAYRATAQLSPSEQIICAVAGGVIALAAHGGKTAVRAAVTPSPGALLQYWVELRRRRHSCGIDLACQQASLHRRRNRRMALDCDHLPDALDLARSEGTLQRCGKRFGGPAKLKPYMVAIYAPICWARSTMLTETTSKSSGLALSGTPTAPSPNSFGR